MKLRLIDRSSKENSSITVKTNVYPHFLKIWHYHPELELVYVIKSSGTHFIGDRIEKFEQGDLVLIGKNLPHMWLNDDAYFNSDSTLSAEAIAIHFKDNFFGDDFLTIPEMYQIQELIKKAQYGIKFSGNIKQIVTKIKALEAAKGFDRAILFLTILNALAKHHHTRLLASDGYIKSFYKNDNQQLKKVYEYIFNNFKTAITLTDVAEIAGMNSSAFSRLFKRVNRKAFTKYLNEIRIGYASKLLIEDHSNIAAIAYESGFNNISNFNRQFKVIKKMSPSEYIKNYQKIDIIDKDN